jgi:type IV pilus biogenesis protein CpaD/CtpE
MHVALVALLSGCASRQTSGFKGGDSVETPASVTYSGEKEKVRKML